MGDIGRTEGRSAFRKLIQESVPANLQTRTLRLLDSIVFGAEPILRGLEYFEVRYGSGQPTTTDYPDEGYGVYINEDDDSAWVVLHWRGEFFVIGGSGSASLPAHTHDHETDLTNVGTNTHSDIDVHIADGTIHFTLASLNLGDYVKRDGSTELTADWDVGPFDLTAVDITATDDLVVGDTLDVTGIVVTEDKVYVGDELLLPNNKAIKFQTSPGPAYAPFIILDTKNGLYIGSILHPTILRSSAPSTGVDFPDDLKTDVILESTADTGVTIDGVLIKDSNIAAVDYGFVSNNDAGTDVTGVELEELTDGSATSLHSHADDCPEYKYIKALAQSEGDLHLSDAVNWNVSLALIKAIHVTTLSTDWDGWILRNDNGYLADDANIPALQIMDNGNGNYAIEFDLPYEDEDASDEVHLYLIDNSGSATFDVFVLGYGLK